MACRRRKSQFKPIFESKAIKTSCPRFLGRLRMLGDGLLVSFFLPTGIYDAASPEIKAIMDEEYFVTKEAIVVSTISDKYWSNLWDTLKPCTIDANGLLPCETFVFNSNCDYTILRPKQLLSEIFDQDKIILRAMDSPLITIHFYNRSNPIALEGRESKIDRETPRGFTVTKRSITYQLEDLEPLQLDYVNELFREIWQRIYDEQEEAYDADDYNRGLPPVNSLISQFVVAVTFERQENDCYLTLNYEVYNRTAGRAKVLEADEVVPLRLDKEAELPSEIEIVASIPLADDDDAELSPEDMHYVTLNEDGEHEVTFSITASKFVFQP